MIGALARKFFGSANDRRVKGYQSRVNAINALEPELVHSLPAARRSTTSWFPHSPPCARQPSVRLASDISTCS
jgi:hypothetical protein